MSAVENEIEESVDEDCEGQDVASCSEAHAGYEDTWDDGSDSLTDAKTTIEISGASIIQFYIILQVWIL